MIANAAQITCGLGLRSPRVLRERRETPAIWATSPNVGLESLGGCAESLAGRCLATTLSQTVALPVAAGLVPVAARRPWAAMPIEWTGGVPRKMARARPFTNAV